MKSKLKLLFLLSFLSVRRTTSVPDVDESQVKSWVVERRPKDVDFFTVNMKPSRRCVFEWCQHRFNAKFYSVSPNYSFCSCTCGANSAFRSFIPSMRTCISGTQAASFGGCKQYFDDPNTLLDKPIDLAVPKKNTFKFSVANGDICNLNGSHVHDYNGFESRWENVADGVFFLNDKGNEIEWKADTNKSLSGRIIRLNVTCRTSTRCFLFKASGPVTYYAPVSSSTSSSFPSVSRFFITTSSEVGSSSSSLTISLSSASTSLPLTPSLSSSTPSTSSPPLPPSLSSSLSSSSAPGGGDRADRGTQTGGNDNGVLIGAGVGGAVVLGIVVIVIVFWKRRRAGKTMEKQTKQGKNPVYGTSENDIQLESPNKSESQTVLSSGQDNQPTYQGLIIANGRSNGTAVYSSPEDEYDNCTVYQSLEKPRPGTPVYQSLKTGQAEPVRTTGLPNLKSKPRYTTLPNATGPPIAKEKTATEVPKPNPGAKGQPSQRSSLTPEPVYNVLDGPGSEQGTTPEPLYNILEGRDRGQDYEAANVDPLYNVLEGPNTTYDSAEIMLESNGAQNGPISGQSPDGDPLYNVLEGPESDQKSLEHGRSTAQEPLYNVLEGLDAKKSPLVDQGGPMNEPLYNVLEGPDSGGSNQHAPIKPRPLTGHDNLAYEQTLEMDVPNAVVQRPWTQRESVYEALRGPTQDVYEALGQSGDPHSTC